MKAKSDMQKIAILRSTFIFDKSGSFAHALYGLSHEGHEQGILQQVKAF